MTRTGKLTAGIALVALAVAILFWPRPRYTYQGKTVEEWFKEFITLSASSGPVDAATGLPVRYARPRKAFQEMGTNAVPFLASRINRDLEPTLFEQLASKLPGRFQPKPKPERKDFEAWQAACLLHDCIKAPHNMLREMLKPVLLSSNGFRNELVVSILTQKNRKNGTSTR